jgi:hypothetical protein
MLSTHHTRGEPVVRPWWCQFELRSPWRCLGWELKAEIHSAQTPRPWWGRGGGVLSIFDSAKSPRDTPRPWSSRGRFHFSRFIFCDFSEEKGESQRVWGFLSSVFIFSLFQNLGFNSFHLLDYFYSYFSYRLLLKRKIVLHFDLDWQTWFCNLDKKLLTLFLALNMLSDYFQFDCYVFCFVNMSS